MARAGDKNYKRYFYVFELE